MKKIFLIALTFVSNLLFAQNAIVGSGFTSGWGNACSNANNFEYFSASAGTTFIRQETANGTGNQFFRFGIDWSGTFAQRTITPNSDVDINPEVFYNLNSSCATGGALRINVASTSHNYIFKTLDAGTNPTGRFIFFRVDGTIRTVSSVSHSPTTIYPGQDVTVTANLSGALSAGQGVYLRYTTTGTFSTSTVVEMTGSGTTYTATIPGSVNTAGLSSANARYYIFTSGDGMTISGADADLCTINLNNNGGSNYSWSVQSAYVSTTTGNWSSTSTWAGGVVPPNNQPVTLSHNVNISADLNRSASTTVNTGTTLTVNSGVTFQTSAGITGAGAFTVNGTFQINSGGFSNIAPTYGSGSTLTYASGTTYGRGTEWSATSGAGYPHHVTISNNTTVNLGANSGTGTQRQCAGDLTINTGSTMSLNINAMTQPLRVLGNLNLNGTLTLSGSSGGDIYISGNWVNTGGTFNGNARAVFLNGSGNQTISNSSGTATIPYLIIDKTAGNVQLQSNLNVHGNGTTTPGNVLQLNNLSGNFDLNGYTLSVRIPGSITLNSGTRNITNTASAWGKLEIDNIGNYASPSNVTSITGGGSLNIGSGVKLIIKGGSTNAGGLNPGSAVTNISGRLEIQTRGFISANAPVYSSTGDLAYNNIGATYTISTEWPTANEPDTIYVIGNTNLYPGVSTNLTIDAGQHLILSDQSGPNSSGIAGEADLEIDGNLTNNGSVVLSSNIGSDLWIKGNLTNSGTFVTNNRTLNIHGTGTQALTGTMTIDYLNITSGATLNWNNDNVTIDDSIWVAGTILFSPASSYTFNRPIQIRSTGTFEINSTTAEVILDANMQVVSGGKVDVKPGSKFTLASGRTLTISGANGLILRSTGTSASENASFLQNGTVDYQTSGSASFERYLICPSCATPQQRGWYVGSPIESGTAAVFMTGGGNAMWEYTVTGSGAWASITSETTLTPAKGYLARVFSNAAYTSTGKLNNAAQSYSFSSATNRWHLVSNPYPSAINWQSSGITKNNIQDRYWINTGQNQFAFYDYTNPSTPISIPGPSTPPYTGSPFVSGASNLIAPGQSFWVYAISSAVSGGISFNNTARVHNTQSFLRQSNSSSQVFRLTVFSLTQLNFYDQAALRVNAQGSDNLTPDDAVKQVSSNANIPQVFFPVSGSRLILNDVAPLPQTKIFPLGFRVGIPGDYGFEIAQLSNFPAGTRVFIEDLNEGIIEEITNGMMFKFKAGIGETITRFRLRFELPMASSNAANNIQTEEAPESRPTVDILENDDFIEHKVYRSGSQLVLNSSEVINGSIEVYDVNGKLMMQSQSNGNRMVTLPFQSANGVYFVRFNSGNELQSVRFVW